MGNRCGVFVLLLAAAACGNSDSTGGGGGADGGNGGGGNGGGNGGGPRDTLVISPSDDQIIDVVAGGVDPTVTYTATYNDAPANINWRVDRGEIGTVDDGPIDTSIFTPSGSTGGVVTVVGEYLGQEVERRVLVRLTYAQDGPSGSDAENRQIAGNVNDLTAGGGIGGVGGEGLGPALDDDALENALENPTSDGSAQNLALLYPYNDTLWPRGLLAPLLQWRWDEGDADAVRIELETSSGSFRYSGTFGRPDILGTTGGNFIRHPIPQDAWTMATNTAGGVALDGSRDDLTMRITVAKDGVGYGPLEQNYRIAPARLAGTIYYQSYGTNLAKNFNGAVGGDGRFGGAVLSIKVGDVAPQLAAGSDGNSSNCRVCHSVAADGSRLIAQTNQSDDTFGYAITPDSITATDLVTESAFPGLTPDGAYALDESGDLLDLLADGAVVATTGLDNIGNFGTPMFSPAGNRVAFNPMNGSAIENPAQSIVVMDFDQSTLTFSNLVEIVDTSELDAEERPGWAAFSPDDNTVVYQRQLVAGIDGNNHGDLRTRKNAQSYLSWTTADGNGTSTPLAKANGVGLPTLPGAADMNCTADGSQVGNTDPTHENDFNYNYEPTINPVASGGYAWIVLTSRRMYGNVATIPPFCSDPRGVDLIENITPKKLWVAAIDLNAPAGSDPSYPAFYLPAQELLAGNARGFWTLDPCRPDGDSCETGDQCCNGFCSDNGEGELVCGSGGDNECSLTQEVCENAGDCCTFTDSCIGGFCTPFVIE